MTILKLIKAREELDDFMTQVSMRNSFPKPQNFWTRQNIIDNPIYANNLALQAIEKLKQAINV